MRGELFLNGTRKAEAAFVLAGDVGEMFIAHRLKLIEALAGEYVIPAKIRSPRTGEQLAQEYRFKGLRRFAQFGALRRQNLSRFRSLRVRG